MLMSIRVDAYVTFCQLNVHQQANRHSSVISCAKQHIIYLYKGKDI